MATIQKPAGPVIDLGKIQVEEQTKDANLFFKELPVSDADKALIFDLFGTKRSINITGIFSGGSQTDLRTFITNVDNIINGNQLGNTFVSNLIIAPTSRKVWIKTWRWSYSKGEVLKINYTLELLEGLDTTQA